MDQKPYTILLLFLSLMLVVFVSITPAAEETLIKQPQIKENSNTVSSIKLNLIRDETRTDITEEQKPVTLNEKMKKAPLVDETAHPISTHDIESQLLGGQQEIPIVDSKAAKPEGIEIMTTSIPTSTIVAVKPKGTMTQPYELRHLPLLDVVKVAKLGGKSLSPEVKAYVENGYKFYQANLGINLGPVNDFEFDEVVLAFELSTTSMTDCRIVDIFPQTTYEELLKSNVKVGLDFSLKYKIPVVSVPEAGADVGFAVEPIQWVWKVATIASTGSGTSKARWQFRVKKNVANLETSIVFMTKSKQPIPVEVTGRVEINPGWWQRNQFYSIEPVSLSLRE